VRIASAGLGFDSLSVSNPNTPLSDNKVALAPNQEFIFLGQTRPNNEWEFKSGTSSVKTTVYENAYGSTGYTLVFFTIHLKVCT